MTAPQEYRIPAGPGEASFAEKKSKFIGRVWPVASEAEASAHLAAMREKHWDATHNAYAYGIRNGQTRCGDDGEPQGTAGRPALNVFQSENVHNFCCVVTRYYGGVLLGAGGLVRAYSKAAKSALDAAGVSLMRQWDVFLIPCPYALYDRVKVLVAAHGGVVESTDFAADALVEALIPVDKTQEFLAAIRDASSASTEPEHMGDVFRGVKIR